MLISLVVLCRIYGHHMYNDHLLWVSPCVRLLAIVRPSLKAMASFPSPLFLCHGRKIGACVDCHIVLVLVLYGVALAAPLKKVNLMNFFIVQVTASFGC